MESAVAADLKQLKLIFRIFQKYDNSISPEEIYKEIPQKYFPDEYLPDDYKGPNPGTTQDILGN